MGAMASNQAAWAANPDGIREPHEKERKAGRRNENETIERSRNGNAFHRTKREWKQNGLGSFLSTLPIRVLNWKAPFECSTESGLIVGIAVDHILNYQPSADRKASLPKTGTLCKGKAKVAAAQRPGDNHRMQSHFAERLEHLPNKLRSQLVCMRFSGSSTSSAIFHFFVLKPA